MTGNRCSGSRNDKALETSQPRTRPRHRPPSASHPFHPPHRLLFPDATALFQPASSRAPLLFQHLASAHTTHTRRKAFKKIEPSAPHPHQISADTVHCQ